MASLAPNYIKLIGAHHPDASLWEAETTLVAKDLRPGGGIQAVGDTDGLVYGLGEYAGAAANLYAQVEHGGLPDAGARVAVASASTGPWFGWDEPTTAHTLLAIDAYAGSSERNSDQALGVAADGSLLYVGSKRPSSSDSGITLNLYRRTTYASSWSSIGSLGSTFAIDPISDYPAGDGACPRFATLADGTVVIAFMHHQTNWVGGGGGNETRDTQVYLYQRTPDDDTWSAGDFVIRSIDVLNIPVRRDSADPGPTGMGFAVGGGQALLVIVHDGVLHQYAGSTPDNLRQISATETTAGEDVCVTYGQNVFVVAARHASTNTTNFFRLGDATISIAEVTPVNVNTGHLNSPGLSCDERGVFYFTVRGAASLNVIRSEDGAQSWTTVGVAQNGATDGHGTACYWRGQIVATFETVGATGLTKGAASLDLGGWTTLPMPPSAPKRDGNDEQDAALGRLLWDASWWAIDSLSVMNASTTGAPTLSYTTSYRLRAVCGVGDTATISNASISTSGVPNIIAYECRLKITSGTATHYVLNTSTFPAIRIDHTSTGITVVSLETGTPTLGSATVSGEIGIRVWINLKPWRDGGPTAQCRVWYTSITGSGESETWTLVTDDDIAPNADAGSQGTSVTINASSEGDIIAYSHAISYGQPDMSPPLAYGRPLSGAAQYALNGVLFAGHRGPFAYGDTFLIPKFSDTAAILAAATGYNPSPRVRFETEDTTSGYIAWKIAESATATPAVWLAWAYTNAETVTLSVHDGTSWSDVGDIKISYSMTSDGKGRAVYGTSESATSTTWIARNSLAGGWIKRTTAGTPRTYTIARNTAGSLRQVGTAGQQALFTLDEELASDFTAGTAYLSAPQAFAVIVPSGRLSPFRNIKGFRLRLVSSDGTPSGNHWLKCAIGPAVTLGFPHGQNTRRTWEGRRETSESTSGVTSSRRYAPTVESVEVSWQDMLDATQRQVLGVFGSSSEPDKILDGQGNPVYMAGSTMTDVASLIDEWQATGSPVVYIPSFPTTAATTITGLVERGQIVGTIESSWTVEDVGGSGLEEGVTMSQRGGSLTIRKIT